MSFDLSVWSSNRPITVEEAASVYTQLCQGNISVLTPTQTSREAIAAFLAEMTLTYPQIDDLPENEVDDCPWNAAFDQSNAHLIIPMAWSRVAEVAPYIKILAYKHALVCYDPQEDSVQLPPF